MGGFRPYQSPHGAIESKAFAPLAPSQTFEAYDPVYLVANQLTVSPTGAEIADTQLIGFAATPATGSLAGSRTAGTGTLEQAAPGAFGDVGAQENVIREYIRPTQGQLFATHNFWAAAGGAQDSVGGTDLGGLYSIGTGTTGEYGLIDAAATLGTDVAARIVQVIGTDGNPFNADTADTLCTGNASGPLIVFEIANLHEITQISGGN